MKTLIKMVLSSISKSELSFRITLMSHGLANLPNNPGSQLPTLTGCDSIGFIIKPDGYVL